MPFIDDPNQPTMQSAPRISAHGIQVDAKRAAHLCPRTPKGTVQARPDVPATYPGSRRASSRRDDLRIAPDEVRGTRCGGMFPPQRGGLNSDSEQRCRPTLTPNLCPSPIVPSPLARADVPATKPRSRQASSRRDDLRIAPDEVRGTRCGGMLPPQRGGLNSRSVQHCRPAFTLNLYPSPSPTPLALP